MFTFQRQYYTLWYFIPCLFIAEIFEVAYAIVDSETIENWRWFLSILSRILRRQERVITFMSDKHDGILRCIPEFFPESPHSYCLVHLKQNVSSLFPKGAGDGLKKKMMNLLANCAYACTASDFDIAEFMDNGRGHVKNFIADLPKENYAIAHFPGRRCGSMSNSLFESFNAMVSNSCCMLLMDLLEDIRVRLMVSMAEKKLFGQNIHTILCPKKENELRLLLKEGMHWRISRSDMHVFEVRTEWNPFVVCLDDRTCSCVQWQHNCFPCHCRCGSMIIVMYLNILKITGRHLFIGKLISFL